MRKKLTRLLALSLTLAMLLGMTALAADQRGAELADGEKAKIHSIVGVDGSNVEFDASNADYITVTYEHASLSGQYLVMMLKAPEQTDSEGKLTGYFDTAAPVEGTILYIDQMEAEDGADADELPEVTFKVYPQSIQDSVIVIYGLIPSADGEGEPAKSLKAAIVDAKYLIGDVDGNGKIGLPDAILILKDIANLNKLEGTGLSAGDVDKNGSIGLPDAILVLKVIAGLIGQNDL